MSDSNVQLTPAQVNFVKSVFPGFKGSTISGELAGRAASQRSFTRIYYDNKTFILVVWDSRDEDWERFLTIGSEREKTLFLLPEIFAADPEHGLILEEDLGVITLKQYCISIEYARKEMTTQYKSVLDALNIWHHTEMVTHPLICERAMDKEMFLWESSYFARFCVIDYCGCEALLDSNWESERTTLAEECAALKQTIIHRDFQSENILLYHERVRFVDFQGARLGPPEYDVSSLIFDPYITAIDISLIDEFLNYYEKTINEKTNCTTRSMYICGAQRLMQALGAYGNLTLHKGKIWYQQYIPIALKRLCYVLQHSDDFPALNKVANECRRAVAERQS